MMFLAKLSLLLLLAPHTHATEAKLHGNPIRRVVTMLQEMQKTVQEEGETEKELYDKSMCYCTKTGAELAGSIESANAKISELTAQIEEDSAAKSQLDQDVGQHKTDRADAEKSISEATAMREKEAAQFAAESGEMKSNIASVDGALTALRQGLGAAMLQTGVGEYLRSVVRQSPLLGDTQREVLGSFLQGGSQADTSGGSDQILGILETMLENMQEDLKETTASEASSVASYQELMGAKNAEVKAATTAIESKMGRSGELGVSIATANEDLENTGSSVEEDTKMKVNLEKSCATKTKEYDARRGTRAEEITAISETVSILNEDDSLDTFKKTLPSSAASFLQLSKRSVSSPRRVLRSRQLLQRAKDAIRKGSANSASPQLSLMLLQVRQTVQTKDFGVIVEMIEKMIALLKREQGDDDKQKGFCDGELAKAAQDTADTRESIKTTDTDIARTGELVETVEAEIASLKAGIADLDTSVAQATDQRKQEHAEYTSTAQANQAAIDLIDMAKNRLNKFYNPTMYNPSVTPAPSVYGFFAQETPAAVSLVQVSARAAKAGGVLQMLATMIGDVEQDMAVAKADELDAQKEYEEVMGDATAKRATDSKLIVTKETLQADLNSRLDDAKSDRGAGDAMLQGLLVKTGDLHATCDFLLDNYDIRKEARTAEVEGLVEGKAVLSSAGSDEAAGAGFLQRA